MDISQARGREDSECERNDVNLGPEAGMLCGDSVVTYLTGRAQVGRSDR